eukprot:10517353-Karenia_brevis.AAC.1
MAPRSERAYMHDEVYGESASRENSMNLETNSKNPENSREFGCKTVGPSRTADAEQRVAPRSGWAQEALS